MVLISIAQLANIFALFPIYKIPRIIPQTKTYYSKYDIPEEAIDIGNITQLNTVLGELSSRSHQDPSS